MKLPWSKKPKQPFKRGPYRTAEARAKDAAARTEAILQQSYQKFLREHPDEALEIAKRKFGLDDHNPDDGEYDRQPPERDDPIAILRQAKEIREIVRDELGTENKGPSALASIVELVKEVPGIIQALPQLMALQSQQANEHAALPAPAPVRSKEQVLSDFATRFMSLTPEQAAKELYDNRNIDGDVRAGMWNMVTESLTADDIISLLPVLPPQYSFLNLSKLSTPEGKLWLNSTLNEVKTLQRRV